ncbi:cytidylyltransferase domain-containing protein [Chloroflexota bacterium]
MILGLIPARSGSKGVPKKNIRPLAGYPLIAYSIIASRLSSKIERTIVSTDSEEFAKIALSYGAEVPFLRPKEFAQDSSLDIDWVRHALKWLQSNEGNQPEYAVMLPPTVPLRDPDIIDAAIEKISQNNDATSLRSSHLARESPCKLFGIKEGFYVGLCPNDPRPEYYNFPRQSFPPIYEPNGHVEIIKPEVILNLGSLLGPRILAFFAPNGGNVDSLEDLEFIEFLLAKHGNPVYQYLKDNFPSNENVRV